MHYLEAAKAINLANDVFGFNGWNSSIQNIQIDFVDENPQTGKVSLGLSVIVRVTLKDGTYHEDIGYGHVENVKGKAAAFEKAKKQGTSDAVKRSLRYFGKVLGNCFYDKEYLSKVTKMKVGAGKWDPDKLHRHPDFATKKGPAVKSEPQAPPPPYVNGETAQTDNNEHFEGMDFDDAVFDDDEFGASDEFVSPAELYDNAKKSQAPVASTSRPTRPMTTPSRPPAAGPNAASVPGSRGPSHHARGGHDPTSRTGALASVGQGGHPDAAASVSAQGPQFSSPGIPSQHFNAQQNMEGPPVRNTAFFSARAADQLDENNNVVSGVAKAFNPQYESPSLRRNPNIDHTKSMRLLRNLKPDTDPPPQEAELNASDQPNRPAPPANTAQSPAGTGRGFNAGQYRPPTRRGPDGSVIAPASNSLPGSVDRVLQASKRAPLGDLSNMQNHHQATATTPDGTDAKRQRMTAPGQPQPNMSPHMPERGV